MPEKTYDKCGCVQMKHESLRELVDSRATELERLTALRCGIHKYGGTSTDKMPLETQLNDLRFAVGSLALHVHCLVEEVDTLRLAAKAVDSKAVPK